jgi:hypothetical protein
MRIGVVWGLRLHNGAKTVEGFSEAFQKCVLVTIRERARFSIIGQIGSVPTQKRNKAADMRSLMRLMWNPRREISQVASPKDW